VYAGLTSKTYSFYVVAYTGAGKGEVSRATSVSTPKSSTAVTQTIVIVVVVAFVVILSIGYAYERRYDDSSH
jgi:hypothetical protein